MHTSTCPATKRTAAGPGDFVDIEKGEEDGEGQTLQGLRGLQAGEQRQHLVFEEINVGPLEDVFVSSSEMPVLRRCARQGQSALFPEGFYHKPRDMRPSGGLYPPWQLYLSGYRGRGRRWTATEDPGHDNSRKSAYQEKYQRFAQTSKKREFIVLFILYYI